MKKVLIAEPDPVLRRFLCEIVKALDENSCIFQTDNVAEAYRIADENLMELLIVDTTMGAKGGNEEGLKFAADIRRRKSYVFVPLIMISGSKEDEFAAFHRLHSYGFLKRPFQTEPAVRLIKEALCYKPPENKKEFIHLRYGCIVYPVRIADIIFIEHKRRKMYVYTTEGMIEIPYQTCEKMIRQLEGNCFEICARGRIVNMRFVRSLDTLQQCLILKEEYGRLGVGRNYIRKMKDTLREP